MHSSGWNEHLFQLETSFNDLKSILNDPTLDMRNPKTDSYLKKNGQISFKEVIENKNEGVKIRTRVPWISAWLQRYTFIYLYNQDFIIWLKPDIVQNNRLHLRKNTILWRLSTSRGFWETFCLMSNTVKLLFGKNIELLMSFMPYTSSHMLNEMYYT